MGNDPETPGPESQPSEAVPAPAPAPPPQESAIAAAASGGPGGAGPVPEPVPAQPANPMSPTDQWMCSIGGRLVAFIMVLVMIASIAAMVYFGWKFAQWVSQ